MILSSFGSRTEEMSLTPQTLATADHHDKGVMVDGVKCGRG